MDEDAVRAELRLFDLFKDLPEADLAQVAAAVTDEVSFTDGAVILEQGRPALDCLLVVEGTAEIRRGTTAVTTIGAGDVTGEIGSLEHSFRTASVVATSPVRAYLVPGANLRRLLEQLPPLAESFRARMGDRLAELRGEPER